MVTAYDALWGEFQGYVHAMPTAVGVRMHMDATRLLLEELRNRVQFIQVRAADVRLGHQLSQVLEQSTQRLVPHLTRLRDELEATENGAQAIAEFGEKHGDLLRAVALSVGRVSGRAGAAVLEAGDVARSILTIASGLGIGVGGNLLTDSLKGLASVTGG